MDKVIQCGKIESLLEDIDHPDYESAIEGVEFNQVHQNCLLGQACVHLGAKVSKIVMTNYFRKVHNEYVDVNDIAKLFPLIVVYATKQRDYAGMSMCEFISSMTDLVPQCVMDRKRLP